MPPRTAPQSVRRKTCSSPESARGPAGPRPTCRPFPARPNDHRADRPRSADCSEHRDRPRRRLATVGRSIPRNAPSPVAEHRRGYGVLHHAHGIAGGRGDTRRAMLPRPQQIHGNLVTRELVMLLQLGIAGPSASRPDITAPSGPCRPFDASEQLPVLPSLRVGRVGPLAVVGTFRNHGRG